MKHFKNIILFATILCSCGIKNSSQTSSIISTSSTSFLNHDYSEIENKKISWNSLFFLAKTTYFVYFYSLNCGYCNEIKNTMIEYGLIHDNFYFIQDNPEVKIIEDTSSTTGTTTVEQFGILGFPALVKIDNGVCVKNLAGAQSIYLELNL